MDLFKDIIPAIMTKKEEVITSENEKDYVPFIVNKSLSFHFDTILFANEMNTLPNADRLLQFQYYLNRVRAWKRPFKKWHKHTPLENIDIVSDYYDCSNEKAADILRLLTNEQLEIIKNNSYKGGLNDKSQRISRGKT